MSGAGEGAKSTTLPPLRVAAVGSYSISAPGFRIRMLLPRTYLAEAKVFLTPLTLFTEDEEAALHRGSIPEKLTLMRTARKRLLTELDSISPDVSLTLIQRQADLFRTRKVEQHAIRDRPLVYDVDDAIWLDTWRANGSIFAFVKGSQRKAQWLATCAEHVIVGNDILAEYLAPYAARITVIPSAVDTDSSPVKAHADGDELIVGWIGSRTTAPYVKRVLGVLAQVSHDLKPRGVRLVMVGGQVKAPPEFAYEALPWSLENERDTLQRIDIGIMPQPDTPWTRGKCAYKAILYMAAGIPVIADDVGIAADVIADCGIVVHSDPEWLEALTALASDAGLRAELGSLGRSRAREAYSVERWAPILSDVLRRAL
jgi:glycosyltransferase involved in cell wall biosynthesis